MAQSRRDSLKSTLAGRHDFIFEYCCSLCEDEGNVKEAIGYCSDCEAYLCEECFNTHLRPKPLRHHQLLDRHQMPKDQTNTDTVNPSSTLKGGSDFIYEICCDFCDGEGQQKEAVGYCSDCRKYLCTDCFNHHLKPRPSRHHVLLDQHQMPKYKQAHHVMDVRVRSGNDSKLPCITGCVVLPGDKLVLVDRDNSNVKLVYLTRSDVVSQLKLPWDLWDITEVSSKQVAVTSPREQTIYFVNVEDKLKLDREVKVKGQCLGIASINNNFVVSYEKPEKVEIISMQGTVLQTVVTEDKGKQLFTHPFYIAVSKYQQTIYISDPTSGTAVTSVDLTGKVQATYKDDKLKGSRGLTVDTAGTVFVCDMNSDNILQLTADLTEGRQLLQNSDGVTYPHVVCYCETTGMLFVGIQGEVKVFQMK